MASSDGSLTNENEDEIALQRELEHASRSSAASQQNAGASLNDSVSAVYDMRKDDRYWERRRKNNEAAKRSREKRRMNDIVMEKRIVELSTENSRLRTEIERLRRLYNISESDMHAALGPVTSATQSSAVTSAGKRQSTASESLTSTRKRRPANGDCPRRSAQSNGARRSQTLADAASNSDASSTSSVDRVSLTPRSFGGDQLPRSTSAQLQSQAVASSSTKRRSNDTKPPTVETSVSEVHAHQQLGLALSSPNAAANKADCADLSAASGSAPLTVPDLVTVLGMLQNPLLQTLLKGGQPQLAANALPVLQQLAVLQQLCGLNSTLLTTSPATTNSPVSAATASNSQTTGQFQSGAGSSGSGSALRSSAALDLRCKPGSVSSAPEGGQLVTENRNLRVELDQINAEVRELKEILLQRGIPVSAATDGNAKRRSNQNAHLTRTSVDDEEYEEYDEDERATCSKRIKREPEIDSSASE